MAHFFQEAFPSPVSSSFELNLERPSKRPRLSMCPEVSPDTELENDRTRNDLSLKSRFDRIIEKYGKDFTGVGDEINVLTGRVVVDNGHLRNMRDEADTGLERGSRKHPHAQTTAKVPGRSLLRAMTVASDRSGVEFENLGGEDIIQSIEAMAGRAVAELRTAESGDDSDDEMSGSDPQEARYRATRSSSSDSLLGIGNRKPRSEYTSDEYPVDQRSQQSSSPDSLLGAEERDSSMYSFKVHEMLKSILPPPTASITDETMAYSPELRQAHLAASTDASAEEPEPGTDAGILANADWRAGPRILKILKNKSAEIREVHAHTHPSFIYCRASTTPALSSQGKSVRADPRDLTTSFPSECLASWPRQPPPKSVLPTKRLPPIRYSKIGPDEEYDGSESDDPLQ